MSSFKQAAAAALAIAAFSAPTLVANPASATGASAVQASLVKARVKVSVSFSRGYQHFMQTPDTIKVNVKGLTKGKATFSVDGSTLGTKKLKRGKASFTLPTDLAVGKHAVKVKVGKASGSKSFTVYSGGVLMTSASYTYSKSAYLNGFEAAGTVTWKGTPASGGFVDIYKAPFQKGESSPDFMCMTSIRDGGGFTFNFCSGFNSLPEGTYQLQAFYTPDTDYNDYVTGTPFTVTITA